jgi:class 3 adenylate cyclase
MLGGAWDCPCKTHAALGTALAYSIVELLHCISSRLGFEVSCRCGVHTGSVVGGMIGLLLPRFLIYGNDLDIAKLLERTADKCSVQISEATKRLIDDDWRLEAPRTVPCPFGADVIAYTVRRYFFHIHLQSCGPSLLAEISSITHCLCRGGEQCESLLRATGGNQSALAR